MSDAGEAINNPVRLEAAFATQEVGAVRGRVALIDHFGNAITTIRDLDLGNARIGQVRWGSGATSSAATVYDEISDGVAALIGSAGHLELAARGSAAGEHGGPKVGDDVTVELR